MGESLKKKDKKISVQFADQSSSCVLSTSSPPPQPFFLKGVRLVNSGDYSSAVDRLEEALRLYLHECDLCRADCEGVVPLPPPDTDFYAVLAG